jgi:uncharacterized protein YbaR (Trm112 family)
MKDDLMEIICCPVCKGDLALRVDDRDEKTKEILRGGLRCASCEHEYPIEDGIPNLLPPDETEA